MSDRPERGPPTREQVLAYLDQHPGQGGKNDIARGLKVPVEHRAALRSILFELESEGVLSRTGKRAFAAAENPPPTGVVIFERIDKDGDLIGRASGRDGPYGPDIFYLGPLNQNHAIALAPGQQALCRIDKGGDGVWRARAIRKLEAAPALAIVGVYRETRYGGRVEPTSRKEKADYLVDKIDAGGAVDGDLVRISPKSGRGYGPRRGKVIEVVGRFDDPRSASLIAMHTHGVPDEFPEVVIEEANAAKPAKVPREDLTRIPLLTIDPEDARDHDDAVWAEPEGNGGWRVIVAIADVSAFVHEGSALDREAYKRGNSTYFPDRVSPMLPEHLSADLCSLRENEVRETMAFEMVFDASGAKRSFRLIRGRMKSAAKLSYRQAQDAIDGHPDEKTQPLLETVLKPLWAAWRVLDKARKARNPLELDLPERRVRIGETGAIASITLRDRFDAHKLIEEFMIQANVCAAEALEQKRSPQLYRVHEEPSDAKIAGLAEFLPGVGLKWTRGEKATGARFNQLLADAKATENEHLINEMVLRSQAQARYSNDNLGHFGLNLAKYAHFTSPIRRYSDLITHRLLIRAYNLGPDGAIEQDIVRLEEFAEQVTMTERRSMAAEREATDRYLAIFMADKVGAQFAGRIAGVTRAGLFIRLDETGADGFSPAARLGEEYWMHDEAHGALVGSRTQRRYEMGMPVVVRLAEATPLTGGLLFEMISDPKPARRNLKAPPGEARQGRGPGPGQARALDGGGRPPGIRHSRKKGKASYGKNKKGKKR